MLESSSFTKVMVMEAMITEAMISETIMVPESSMPLPKVEAHSNRQPDPPLIFKSLRQQTIKKFLSHTLI